MTKIIRKTVACLALACLLPAAAYARDFEVKQQRPANGFYAGGQLGFGHSDYSRSYPSSGSPGISARANKVEKDGLAGRLYIGYQFIPYLAAEVAYTHFQNVRFKEMGNDTSADGKLRLQAGELAVKGILPIEYVPGLAVFARGGVAFLDANGSRNSEAKSFNFQVKDARGVVPVYGAGISYGFNENIAVNAVWVRFQGTSSRLETADFLGAGLELHIG